MNPTQFDLNISSTIEKILQTAGLTFDINHENWSEYIERIEQYFIANDIDAENKKKGTLLTVIGSETYRLVRNLVSPTKPCDKTYDQLVEAFES